MKHVLCTLACAAILGAPLAADLPDNHSPYAGLETREIKTLSADDIEQLRAGHGWGLSLVAELNGVPGPRHLLDMRKELNLTEDQLASIEAIYLVMKEGAIPLGEELIRLERDLDKAFADGSIDEARLAALLDSIATTRRDLRHVHLSAHLQTPPLLGREQILEYSRLRGYGAGDPCRAIPPGHDPEMWRRHNHCD